MKTNKGMLRSILFLFQEKPQIGFTGTAGGFALGASPTIFNISIGEIIPWFQLVAFLITIVVGVLTPISMVQRIKKNKKS